MQLINGSGKTDRVNFRKLLRKYGIKGLRAQAMLPPEAQVAIDTAVTRVGRQRLTIVDALISAGLTRPITNWWGVTKLSRDAVSESGHAKMTMVPKARGERQAADRDRYSVPVPCQWDDFSFNIREIEAADRAGIDLDTTHIEQATRNVNELVEHVAIHGWKDANGDAIKIDGLELPGLLDSTMRSANTSDRTMDDPAHTGGDILADLQRRTEVARAAGFYGPFDWFLPSNLTVRMNEDFKTATDKSLLARLRELEYGGRPVNIRFADMLPDDTDLLIQMTSDVVEVSLGQTPTPITWEDGPGFEEFGVVLACVIARVFPNYLGNYGVVVGTPDGEPV